MPEADKDLVISALVESNDSLQEENVRLRNNNRVLRTVVGALRDSVTKLKESVLIAQQNDEIFKSYCQGNFDAPVSSGGDAGLADPTGTVEPLG